MSLLAFLLTLGDELCALYISIICQKLCMFITLINNLLQHICVKCQGNSALLESKRLWLMLLVLVCHYLRHTFIFVCIHSCVNSLIHSFIHLPNFGSYILSTRGYARHCGKTIIDYIDYKCI